MKHMRPFKHHVHKFYREKQVSDQEPRDRRVKGMNKNDFM